MIVDTITPNQKFGSTYVKVYEYSDTTTCHIAEIAFSLNSDFVTMKVEHSGSSFELQLQLPDDVGLDGDAVASIVEVQTKKWILRPNVEADKKRPFRLYFKSDDDGKKTFSRGILVRRVK